MVLPTYIYKISFYLRWIFILLNQHKAGWNLNIMSFECTLCSATFTKKPSLCKHINQIHKKICYPCHSCEKSYTSQQSLDIHIQSVHEKQKHNCDFCNSSFRLKRSLILHLRAKHSPIIVSPENGASVQWVWFIVSWEEEPATTYEKKTWIKEIQM